MGRTPSWDRDEVLADARHLFRERGFAGTSLRDIEQATGVHPGSLYRSFGDKRGLFAAALQSYNERVVEERVRVHLDSADDARSGILSFFLSTLTPNDDLPGCLVTNSAVEAVTLDESLLTDVRAGLATIERGLRDALERLRSAGELRSDSDPDRVAGQLLALYQGTLVLVRCDTDPEKLTDVIRGGVDALVGTASSTSATTPNGGTKR